jgi:hypothetical protein
VQLITALLALDPLVVLLTIAATRVRRSRHVIARIAPLPRRCRNLSATADTLDRRRITTASGMLGHAMHGAFVRANVLAYSRALCPLGVKGAAGSRGRCLALVHISTVSQRGTVKLA